MRFRSLIIATMCAVVASGLAPGVSVARARRQQQSQNPARGEGTPAQRVTVMRSRLDNLRRTLNAALAGLNAAGDDKKDKEKKSSESAARLRGLEREAGHLGGEIADISSKIDRADKYESSELDKLEGAVADLNERAERALQETAGERRVATATAANAPPKKKKGGGGFLGLGRLFGGGGDEDKYAELMSGVKPGRDRELFEEAAKLTRKSNYEGARLLFETIINTYPESPYLPHAKLAIADTFYLEGTTSALIQAGNAYQEWLTFFPTDPLADEVMLKAAEVEMRQMGLPDRDVTHARKAEQRLRALLQQFPETTLRPDAQIRLNETQELLGMHTFSVGNFYYDRYLRGVAPNPKGAQSRYREVVEKYPNFSRTDKALYLLAETYVQEEQPDEAAKYFQRILREFPQSEFAEKASEQLDAIGAAKPEADKNAKQRVPPPDRGMMRRFLEQVIGTPNATTDRNGVLISKDSDAPALIDVVIENKGTLPATVPTATRSSTRIAPARPAAPAPQPAPVKKNDGDGVKPQPTKTGQPATGSDPTKPSVPPPGA
ncbi:MAG TPA: outer membrane protein assembly factor BamD [Pyrinomonadaceae bacterium]|jgi:outer membrane protein assembly factor BamD|nr:outer membrane protein assembly factor BamD [Pyrinomonadaceae bacterium]